MATKLRSLIVLGAAAVSVMFLVNIAHAGSSSSNMTVSATVVPSCTISAGALAFGNYDPIVANASTDLDATATLSVACSSGANTNIVAASGANVSGGQRRMKSGSNFLNYNLFSDSAHAIAWPISAPGVTYVGIGGADTLTVYGRVPAAQSQPVGSYTDTVLVTINF